MLFFMSLLVIGVFAIVVLLKRIALAFEEIAKQGREPSAAEPPKTEKPPVAAESPAAAVPQDDDDGNDPPIIAQLKKRGFVVWLMDDPPPGRVGIGDLRFEPSSDPDDTEAPQLFCPQCSEPMFDFAEAVERKNGKDEPNWCEYGSACVCCGFYFEDEASGYSGFFGPLIEESYDFNEIFRLLDDEDLTEQRKLLARREAAAMRQVLTVRSQRRALERTPPKEKPAIVLAFEKPPKPAPPEPPPNPDK